MRIRRMAVFAFVIISVCALLGAVEFTQAEHTATVNNLPENVDSGQTGITFTLQVTNDLSSIDNIDDVKISVDEVNFTNLNAIAPTDWIVEIVTPGGNNFARWTTITDQILPGFSEEFTWYSDAPTVAESTRYNHDVNTRCTAEHGNAYVVDTMVNPPPVPEFPTGLAAVFASGLLVYIFSGRLQ